MFRPWPAEDGLLVRLRLVGGHLSGAQLDSLLSVSERYGDGAIHLTARANVQVRGLAGDGSLSTDAVRALESTGLVPSREHELVRNVMMSPQSGYAGGRADLRPVAAELDRLLLGDPSLAALPGRFGFVLDDGRGDLVQTRADLGLVVLDATRVQLRIGDGWGPVVALSEAAAVLADLSRTFLEVRGTGPSAAWHVRELPHPLAPTAEPACEVPLGIGSLGFGPVDGGVHAAAPGGVLTRAAAEPLLLRPSLVVTPWRGIFVPSIATPSPRENA